MNVEMVGNKFNKWFVIAQVKSLKDHKRYLCRCDCGFEKEVLGTQLRNGTTKQCKSCAHNITVKRSELIGKKFGKYVVKEEKYKKGTHYYYSVECDCGTKKIIRASTLTAGTKCCKDCANKKHGKSQTRIYNSWKAMIDRCCNKKSKVYKWYGLRGIKVCDRWLKLENFIEDMGDRPIGKSLDRIDNDGNYEFANCRWATAKEQALNRTRKEVLCLE